jgi:hypothetical protein
MNGSYQRYGNPYMGGQQGMMPNQFGGGYNQFGMQNQQFGGGYNPYGMQSGYNQFGMGGYGQFGMQNSQFGGGFNSFGGGMNTSPFGNSFQFNQPQFGQPMMQPQYGAQPMFR